jgi:hypothetical protein
MMAWVPGSSKALGLKSLQREAASRMDAVLGEVR